MPLTDKSDAELAALVAERVLNMSEHIIDEEDPENYPVFQMWGDGNPGPGVGVVIYRERAAWYDNLPECFDPANDLNEIWSACDASPFWWSVAHTQDESECVAVVGAATASCGNPARAMTIALLRACGIEEE